MLLIYTARDCVEVQPHGAHTYTILTMGAVGAVAIERTVKHKGGRDAKEASPAFIAALNDQDEIVRRYAASALKTIQPDNEPLLPT